jgi:hypothetical protein
MDQHHLVPCRPGPGTSPQEDRRAHVDEWQRDHLGEPPVRRWISRITSRWLAHARGWSMWPNMIVDVARRPNSWAVIITSAHCAVRILSGQRWTPDLVVEDLGGGARQVPSPASLSSVRNSPPLSRGSPPPATPRAG